MTVIIEDDNNNKDYDGNGNKNDNDEGDDDNNDDNNTQLEDGSNGDIMTCEIDHSQFWLHDL